MTSLWRLCAKKVRRGLSGRQPVLVTLLFPAPQRRRLTCQYHPRRVSLSSLAHARARSLPPSPLTALPPPPQGPASLYRGLAPVMARAFPANAACFLGYEMSLKLMDYIGLH